MEETANRAAAAEQRWIVVAVAAVPFETTAACDTCVIQNSHPLSLQITKKGMPKGDVRVKYLHGERIRVRKRVERRRLSWRPECRKADAIDGTVDVERRVNILL